MSGVTEENKIKNEYIRVSIGVDSIVDKIINNRLWWFDHILRKKRDRGGKL